ncbi:MAG TPA: ROK family protein [Mycobacteriales bacterium]
MYQRELVSSDELDEFEHLLGASSLRNGTPVGPSQNPSTELVRRVVHRAEMLACNRYAVGIELLPHRMIGALVDEYGRRLADHQLPLDDANVPTVVDAAASLVASLLRSVPGGHTLQDRVAVGFQLGGPVDTETGTVLFFRKVPPDAERVERGIRWEDSQPLGRLLESAIGLPTVVENDSNAYAVFQQWFGVGREVSRFAVVLIREGVGAALFLGGRLFDGPMELGNLVVFPESGRMCDCGNFGCLETTGGTSGILDTVHTYTGERVEGVVAAARMAERPDVGPKARDAFAAAGHANAKGLGFLVNLARPHRLVLYAPAVMVDPDRAAGQAFLAGVWKFRHYCHAIYGDKTELVVEPLRPFDGSHGAALVALERFYGIRPRTAVQRSR